MCSPGTKSGRPGASRWQQSRNKTAGRKKNIRRIAAVRAAHICGRSYFRLGWCRVTTARDAAQISSVCHDSPPLYWSSPCTRELRPAQPLHQFEYQLGIFGEFLGEFRNFFTILPVQNQLRVAKNIRRKVFEVVAYKPPKLTPHSTTARARFFSSRPRTACTSSNVLYR
jgi:hypothetical protein